MNRKQKIGFGIIGTGAIAEVHAKCIQENEHAELIAMSASSGHRADKARNKYRVPVYSSYKELLRYKDIDIVCICTQSGMHMEPAIAAAKAGKHILCEKPLEINIERADKMIEECKKANVKLGCIFQNRFSKGFLAVKQALHHGSFGTLLMGKASINWYREPAYYSNSPWKGTLAGDGGAVLINQAIHTIDLLLNIMGEYESVFGKVRTRIHDIEGEDTANVLIDFKNGAFGNITASTAAYPGHPERLEIYGERGSVILESGEILEWNLPDASKKMELKSTAKGSGSSDPLNINHDLHKAQIEDMVNAVQTGSNPMVDGEEARKVLELIQDIYKSSAEKREIKRQ